MKKIVLALSLSAALPGVAQAEKICENTYSNGQRCTFCYYTTQPGSGSTHCIGWKAPAPSRGSLNDSAVLDQLMSFGG